MSRRLAAVVAVVASVGVAGCGTGGPEESAQVGRGKELFQQKCASCHALADAGSIGQTGPNLDNAFAAARQEKFDENTVRDVVLGQMRFPVPPMPQPDDPGMFPSNEYTDAERDAAMEQIAAYVASVAGTTKSAAPGGGTQAAGDPKQVFTSSCGGCHVLSAAGTQGTAGPNLDEHDLTVAAIEKQIRNGGGGMPAFADQLSNEQIAALSKYVFRKGK